MSDSLIPSFLLSNSLRSLTKNERMIELRVFLSESLIRSFFCKKRVIRSENERFAQVDHQKWTNDQIERFLSESLIRSFFRKKLAIRSEIRSANYCISGSTSYRKNFFFILAKSYFNFVSYF